MTFRVVDRLGLADAITIANAAVGFLAVVAATIDVGLAARLILLAAIFDGLDGIVARTRGSTPVGKHLDSLADVASFGVAPAMVVVAVVDENWGIWPEAGLAETTIGAVVGVGVAAVFVALAVARLGLYNAYDADRPGTVGVPTTLAASLLAATVLAGYPDPELLVALTAVFALLMVSTLTYPDLVPFDAFVMGLVQALAVVTPGYWGRVFAFALLFLAAGYLAFGPWFYWQAGVGQEEASAGDAAPRP